MNARFLVLGLLALGSVGLLVGAARQRGQVASLLGEQQQALDQLAAAKAQAAAASILARTPAAPMTPEEKLELLRLRSEVTRLRQRQRDLANVQQTHTQLEAQAAARPGGAAAEPALPSGYLRRTQAQMVGLGTPADALQSMLWAIEHRDTNVLQQVWPAMANRLRAALASGQDVFQDVGHIPGFLVRQQNTLRDGSVELQVEFIPGQEPAKVWFQQSDGQWRMTQ